MKSLYALTFFFLLSAGAACGLNPNDITSGNFACRGPADCVDGYECTGADGVDGVCYDPANPPNGDTNTNNAGDSNDNSNGEATDPPEEEEACGNGVIDAGELCDDGDANGVGENPCINYCTERHPWPIDACHATTQNNQPDAERNVAGYVAHNFELYDQNEKSVRLYDFCDRIVVINGIAAWSEPDRVGAQILGDYYTRYREHGLMVTTLMFENSFYEAPGKEDLQEWVNNFNLQHPVLADPDATVVKRYSGPQLNLPFYIVIGRGGVVASIGGNLPSEAEIEELLDL